MSPSSRRGFTLLEVLLAVALTGALLLALNLFVFSMAEIWGRSADDRLFHQHTRAVARHVEGLIRRAALPGVTGPRSRPAVWIEEIRPERGTREPALAFELPAGDRLLAWPERPLPDTVCALIPAPDAGLLLCWYSQLELRRPEDPVPAVVVSPYVKNITYNYYQPDTGDWRERSQLQRKAGGQWETPDAITLHFARGNLHDDALIVLPGPSRQGGGS